ncbi:MAG: heme-binding protein [Planctomycetota bacterium]|jgi:hypothetical protein
MRHSICFATTLLACAVSAIAGSPADSRRGDLEPSLLIKRVGGDLDVQVTRDGVRYRCGGSVVETSLPDGYPAPTPPGAIDVKRYPAVRRAEVFVEGAPGRGRNGAFFSLFRHIQRRDIAMTSPVEMDYPDPSDPASSAAQGWTMSFLYRTPDTGPIEQSGDVRVVDTMPLTVVSVGLRGKYGRATEDRGLQQLSAWLDGQDEWERAGDPRALYYNGPYIRDSRKWAEVQVPVRRAGVDNIPAESETGSEASGDGEEAGGILLHSFRDGRGSRRSPSDTTPNNG